MFSRTDVKPSGAIRSAPVAPRYDSLDMWRGVACLMVLVNHAVTYQQPAGTAPAGIEHLYVVMASVASRLWMGVPIFFVISGYCISATVDNHRRKGSPVSSYFFRRFRRIFPPYWIVLAVMAVVIGVGDVALHGAITTNSGLLRPWWYSPAQWLGSLTLTETWRTHLTGGQQALVLGPAWTLCYEEQFYAVCGLLLFVCPRRFFLGAAVVSLCVGAAAVAGHVFQLSTTGFFFDGAWLLFGMGILLYYALNYSAKRQRLLAVLGFAIILLWASTDVPALLSPEKNDYQQFFVGSLFALVAFFLRPFDRALLNAPSLWPLRRCGLMCYSLYLVHMPVVNVLRALMQASGVETSVLSPFLTLPLFGIPALLLAWQYHVVVERRFMNTQTLPSRHLTPAPLTAV